MAKYIEFVKHPTLKNEGRDVYYITNKRSRSVLATISWYPVWRKWVVEFKEETVWSQDCLGDVREFILRLPAAAAQRQIDAKGQAK